MRWLIGIDEAGRGPLAGPVAVGVVLVPRDFNFDVIPGVGDSKKVSQKKREAVFKHAARLHKEGKLAYAVGMSSAKVIDSIGIVPAIQRAMNQALKKVTKNPRPGLELEKGEVLVKLDGGLKAPSEYVHQETIIKGDSKEKVIGLASIMAKVTRDRYMEKIAIKAPFVPYSFEVHKGYGTKAHRASIEKKGLSTEHRRSFCKNIAIRA